MAHGVNVAWSDRRRKGRSGAFWEGRYHATMVGSGEYLWECLKYIELNMVRCRVVDHPSRWEWSGYGELMGGRTRNRLLDVDKLLGLLRCGSVIEFRQHLDTALEQALLSDGLDLPTNSADEAFVVAQPTTPTLARFLDNAANCSPMQTRFSTMIRSFGVGRN